MNEIEAALAAAGIENARGEAHLLWEHYRGNVPAEVVKKRCTHYPLQYLLGEWAFYRETYEVSPDCLIPRSDTEILVEKAIGMLPNGARFLDLCTGSGCIAVSVAANRPDTNAVAVDLFPNTAALAARNAARNGVAERCHVMLSDVLQGPSEKILEMCQNGAGFSAILSNPPYILDEVVPTLQAEVGYEPAAALCGGADGLDFYRAILDKWRSVLQPDGFFLFEIGYDQGEALRLLASERGFSATVWRDYGGNDRVVRVNLRTEG